MTRKRLFAVFTLLTLLMLASGVFAQQLPTFSFTPLRIVRQVMVWDITGKATGVQAFYLREEWQGSTLCTRVLLMPQGQLSEVIVPDQFCE